MESTGRAHQESRDGTTSDGQPLFAVPIEFGATNDWCDGDEGGLKQAYDISRLLAEVKPRPFAILLDAYDQDDTFVVP